MANIKSAKKRINVNERKRLENKSRKSEIKTYVKKFQVDLDENNIDEARATLKIIDKKLKQAESKNVFHKNNVAKKVSKLTKKLNAKAN